MHPIRQLVQLSGGTVTLRAWGAHVADAHLLDLLTLTVTLGQMREGWHEWRRGDVEPGVWAAFWRLVHASLDGCPLPERLTWGDRLALLAAMWDLNDLEDADPKLTALTRRAQRMLTRLSQGRATASMSGSSAPSA
ncbi:hypothetical protein [Deinococcus murrayi]|uniref:hypothetical protein n=1 Tax=Deinococcus murrayi TaxID=68910 RepID=UPI0004824A8D|nr:hypothetical protein [Deinococcus murrayi]